MVPDPDAETTDDGSVTDDTYAPPPKAAPKPKPAPPLHKAASGGMDDDAPLALIAPKAKAVPKAVPKGAAAALAVPKAVPKAVPEALPAVPKAVLAVPKAKAAPGLVLEKFEIEGYGHIKVDRRRHQFNAHCYCLGPGSSQAPKDHRTASMPECRMNRVAAKKPLAFLVQWLRQGNAYDTRVDHRDSHMLITKDDRQACRDWLLAQDELVEMLQLEAEWNEEPGLVMVED